jgi:hypothetical protein
MVVNLKKNYLIYLTLSLLFNPPVIVEESYEVDRRFFYLCT